MILTKWHLTLIIGFILLASFASKYFISISKNEYDILMNRTNYERKSWYISHLLIKDEYIKAVNVAIGGENVTAKVEIYKNVDYPYGGQDNVPVSGGYLANTTTAYFENSGYVTIELNQPVKIEKDQWFSAIVSVSNEKGDAKIMTSYKNGREMSYINNGSGWTQLKNYVGRIKVYTKLENKVENPTIEVPTTEAQTTTEVPTTSEPTTEAPTT